MGFENELLRGPEVTELPLDELTQTELERMYESVVGVDPTARVFPKEVLITGIEKPEEERARLAELEQE